MTLPNHWSIRGFWGLGPLCYRQAQYLPQFQGYITTCVIHNIHWIQYYLHMIYTYDVCTVRYHMYNTILINFTSPHFGCSIDWLRLMVVAATCGNSVFVTSSPSSIAIRDILCLTYSRNLMESPNTRGRWLKKNMWQKQYETISEHLAILSGSHFYQRERPCPMNNMSFLHFLPLFFFFFLGSFFRGWGNEIFHKIWASTVMPVRCATTCELKSQAFLALANAAILGLYVVIIGAATAPKDRNFFERRKHNCFFSPFDMKTTKTLSLPKVGPNSANGHHVVVELQVFLMRWRSGQEGSRTEPKRGDQLLSNFIQGYSGNISSTGDWSSTRPGTSLLHKKLRTAAKQ